MQQPIAYRLSPDVSNTELNMLFSAGRPSPDDSDWEPVLTHSLVYVCAYSGESLIGFANVAWDGRDHAFLLDPRVHPDYRRRGIGTELVRLAAKEAREAGCEWLHVDWGEPGDEESQGGQLSFAGLTSFYDSCGFRPTAAGVIRLAD